MYKIIFPLFFLIYLTSCAEEKKEEISYKVVKTEKKNFGLTEESIKDKESSEVYWRTTWKEVEVFTKLEGTSVSIETNFDGHKLAIKLSKKDTAYQRPIVDWVSDEFACVHTVVNNKPQNYLFIPYKKETKDISFFNRIIISAYPEKNIVVYVDEIKGDVVTYAAYSASSKKTMYIPITFSKYVKTTPKTDNITFKNNLILITNDANKITQQAIDEIL